MKVGVHVGVVDDGFVHLDQQRKAGCHPVALFLADGDVDNPLGRALPQGEVLED